MNEQTTGAMPQATEPELVLTRFFVAPPRFLFDAWTQQRHLRRWWGPEGAKLTACEIDLHPGGAYRIAVRDADGVERVTQGRYLEVRPPSRLTFTIERSDLPDEPLLTTVTFEEMGAMTRMSVHQSSAHGEPYAHHQLPEWLESLSKLSEWLE